MVTKQSLNQFLISDSLSEGLDLGLPVCVDFSKWHNCLRFHATANGSLSVAESLSVTGYASSASVQRACMSCDAGPSGWKDAVAGFKCLKGTMLAFSLWGLAAVVQLNKRDLHHGWELETTKLGEKRLAYPVCFWFMLRQQAYSCHSAINVFITVSVK